MEAKETEEQTRMRILDECAQELGYEDFIQIDNTEEDQSVKLDHTMYCYENAIEKYHAERKRIEAPSDEEIDKIVSAEMSAKKDARDRYHYLKGLRFARKLLTGI